MTTFGQYAILFTFKRATKPNFIIITGLTSTISAIQSHFSIELNIFQISCVGRFGAHQPSFNLSRLVTNFSRIFSSEVE